MSSTLRNKSKSRSKKSKDNIDTDEKIDQIMKDITLKRPRNPFTQFVLSEVASYKTKNKDAKTVEARNRLFESPTMLFLLDRGKNAVEKWSLDNLFEEKQNDTADILVTETGKFELIDVKTRNLDKKAQPPNIISAFKLAQTCAKMIDNNDFELFDINYFQIDWRLEENRLVCRDAYYAELFKCNPEELYINWAAAMQIQFHVDELKQNFIDKNREEWARRYLKHFTTEAKRRAEIMIDKFVRPFEKYLS